MAANRSTVSKPIFCRVGIIFWNLIALRQSAMPVMALRCVSVQGLEFDCADYIVSHSDFTQIADADACRLVFR